MKKFLFLVLVVTSILGCKKEVTPVNASNDQVVTENGISWKSYTVSEPAISVTSTTLSGLNVFYTASFLGVNTNTPLQNSGPKKVYIVGVPIPNGGALTLSDVATNLKQRKWQYAPLSYALSVHRDYKAELVASKTVFSCIDTFSVFTAPPPNNQSSRTTVFTFSYGLETMNGDAQMEAYYSGNTVFTAGSYVYVLCYK